MAPEKPPTPSGQRPSHKTSRAGTVALIGRPNAGKSTLMNRWLVEKVAIVSDKPQTTRHRQIGILSDERGQVVFHDTPGMHKPLHRMNREMVRYAMEALADADVCCLIVDASKSPGGGDEYLLDVVRRAGGTRVLALNKIDLVHRPRLLPLIQRYGETEVFEEIVPVSARSGDGCDVLLDLLWQRLPEGEALYDPELFTLHPERYLAAERIREKVLERTRDELPFTTAVVIDHWEEKPGRELVKIWASILVESAGQKRILIGRGGSMVRDVGTAARLDLEQLLGRRVYLDLQIRHEAGWRENQRILAALDRELLPGGRLVRGSLGRQSRPPGESPGDSGSPVD